MILGAEFYLRNNVTIVARELLGKLLVTNIDGQKTSGIITETEAYQGVVDKASHAYGGKLTNRTEVMYRPGGFAYVYLCYGIHSLFNVVTNRKDIPHAVLIRSIAPFEGIEHMLARARKGINAKNIGVGPGKVSKLLGINYGLTGQRLTLDFINKSKQKELTIWIEDLNENPKKSEIEMSPRIGVDYAGDDALLTYRYVYNRK